MAAKKQNSDVEKIEPGMVVEATEGDLGEKDVSKPKVAAAALLFYGLASGQGGS